MDEQNLYYVNRGVLVLERDFKAKNVPDLFENGTIMYGNGAARFLYNVGGCPKFFTLDVVYIPGIDNGGCIDYLDKKIRYVDELRLFHRPPDDEIRDAIEQIMHDFSQYKPDKKLVTEMATRMAKADTLDTCVTWADKLEKYLFNFELPVANRFIDWLIRKHNYIELNGN